MLVCVSLPLVTWFDSSLSAWSNSLFFHPLIDARLASVSTLISRLDFHFWRVDRFSFFRGWLACSLFRVISFDHMYFPTWWFSLVDGFHWLMVFRRFWQLVNFLSADDDDDDDEISWILFRSSNLDSLTRVLLWLVAFVFCLFAVYPFDPFVCLCPLTIFSFSPILILTRLFRRWRSCNPGVLKVLFSLVNPILKE